MRVEKLEKLHKELETKFSDRLDIELIKNELTCTLAADFAPAFFIELCQYLHNNSEYTFEQLTDLCGIDYLTYGCSEWETNDATRHGFSRGADKVDGVDFHTCHEQDRFAVVYHLLSIKHNIRLRLIVKLHSDYLVVPTVTQIWPSANWYEREAFDLYGIMFSDHPDLRRILTDYGFIGHPFRKDFPLSGKVEVRYDKTQDRVVYEPVDIEPRISVPKIIRNDYRFIEGEDARN